MIDTDINTYVEQSNGAFTTSLTATFEECEQETLITKTKFPVSRITDIFWSISSVGYVELLWECNNNNHKRIALLSNSSHWSFNNKNNPIPPGNATGNILLSTKGFDELDCYTIILSGAKKQ